MEVVTNLYPMCSGALIPIDDHSFVITCGWVENPPMQRRTNLSVYVNTETKKTHRLASSHPRPSERNLSAVCACPMREDTWVMYGGFTGGFNGGPFLADLWMCQVGPNSIYWELITNNYSDTELPAGMGGHKMCLIGSDVYIFGGLVEGYVTTNDLWKISFLDGSAHWTKVRRRIASANPSRLKLVDYYRAQDNDICYNDVWIFDTTVKMWQQLQLDFIVPPLGFHSTTLLGSQLVVFGGGAVDGQKRNQLRIFDLSDLRNLTAKEYTRQNYQPLYASLSCASFPRIYIVGGSVDWGGLTKLSRDLTKLSFTWSPPSLQELCTWWITREKILVEDRLPEDLVMVVKDYWYDGKHQPNKIVDWRPEPVKREEKR